MLDDSDKVNSHFLRLFMQHDTSKIMNQFWTPGDWLSANRIGNGHINETFKIAINQAGVQTHFLLQRINHDVFPEPEKMMENILLVTNHIRHKLYNSGKGMVSRNVLTPIGTRTGSLCHKDSHGNFWRVYTYIENTFSINQIQKEEQAYMVAKRFAEFLSYFEDMDASMLSETIPDFHNSPARIQKLKEAIKEDAFDRVKLCKKEIDFILQREESAGKLIRLHKEGYIPLRVTHNDTKINNILFDAESKEPICIVDLDTVMPGLCLYDFGDMVRTATCMASEDETDLSKVTFSVPLFKALVKGYLEVIGKSLTPMEIENMAFSGRLMTLTVGTRFLTDFLEGDNYFKIERENQNLDRSRTQLKLVEEMEKAEVDMQRMVNTYRLMIR